MRIVDRLMRSQAEQLVEQMTRQRRLEAQAETRAAHDIAREQEAMRKAILDGHVMEPDRSWEHQAASIICGHNFIQRLPEDEQSEFESFIRDVLRT